MNNRVTSQPMRLSFDCETKMEGFRRVQKKEKPQYAEWHIEAYNLVKTAYCGGILRPIIPLRDIYN